MECYYDYIIRMCLCYEEEIINTSYNVIDLGFCLV